MYKICKLDLKNDIRITYEIPDRFVKNRIRGQPDDFYQIDIEISNKYDLPDEMYSRQGVYTITYFYD